jgi:putative FmdB family regulatory protein
MPIYEFKCRSCGKEFEELVLNKSAEVLCPSCGKANIEKWMSSFRSKIGGDDFGDFSSSGGAGACGGCTQTSCAGCGVNH